MSGRELRETSVVLGRKVFELPCMDSRKSFYGKAKVIECKNGVKLLQSYNTIVCAIDENGEFARLWDGYSVTTMRHVNSFLSFYGLDGGGKAYWDEKEVI